MIGIGRSQTQADDLRPTRLPFVFLCLVALLCACAFMSTRLFPNFPLGPEFPYLAAGSFTLIFAGLMGGPKLWTDWRDRNFWGYYQVFWQIKPNHLDTRFVNHKNLPNVVMRGWSLYLPLGGWRNRPFMSHDQCGRSKNFRIARWKWQENWTEAVTIADGIGDRLTLDPAALLRMMEESFPHEETLWSNGMLALQSRRSARSKEMLSKELDETRKYLAVLRSAASDTIGDLSQLITNIDETDRLKGTKDGKRIRARLSGTHSELLKQTWDTIHNTNESGVASVASSA